jgi:ribose transport system ATP-binding protein
MNNPNILELKNISKRFYQTEALKNVNFELKLGEVHALLGENGAGKSTLLNILNGVYSPDNGRIIVDGEEVEISHPAKAKILGITKVHQELQLIPELTVSQNIFLGQEPILSFPGTINWSEMNQKADELLRSLDLNISAKEYVKDLSPAQMQMVEIAKALQQKSRILALDEPTSSLTNIEIKKLFEIISLLKSSGTSIIYVSHRLDEVYQIADRLTVLRDGNYIGTYETQNIEKPALIRLMVGRDLLDIMGKKRDHKVGEKVLEVKNLLIDQNKKTINFHLRRGEILGFAGLVGSGRTKLVHSIFGADKDWSGDIYLYGNRVNIKSPKDSVSKGIAMVPEDRKLQGFIGVMSNCLNICLTTLNRFRKVGLINHQLMRKVAKKMVEDLHIRPPDIDQPTQYLSGGNQQKVVLGKWLSNNFKIIICDEPTRGIDVGAKSEIYELMHEMALRGNSIIMVSSELPEILTMSDRVLVMRENEIVGELSAEEATEDKIMLLAMGA